MSNRYADEEADLERLAERVRERISKIRASESTAESLEAARASVQTHIGELAEHRARWIARLPDTKDPGEREYVTQRIQEMRTAHQMLTDLARTDLTMTLANNQTLLMREQIASQERATAAAANQAKAMVRWTRVLAFATVALILATFASALIVRL